MYTVKTLNKIAAVGTGRLDKSLFKLDDAAENPDAILVRSAKMHDYTFNPNLLCVARAGAGVNNIPLDRCAGEGIVVFNTPGANAGGVKELVIAALLMASRDILGGIEWVKGVAADSSVDVAAAVEKGKSAFVGPEILGKTLGIIGLGAVGAKVAEAAHALGMAVVAYDPFLSDAMRARLAGKASFVSAVEELYGVSDYITLHVPYMDSTRHTINAASLALMKDGVRIINIARGELVDDDAMFAAIESGKVARYVTDFPNNKTANAKGVVAIPHLGASTPESEDNCAIMAADEISEYLLCGNIVNSVNFPSISMEKSGSGRVVILRKNTEGAQVVMLSAIAAAGFSATATADKARGAFAATIIDLNGAPTKALLDSLAAVNGVIRVRAI